MNMLVVNNSNVISYRCHSFHIFMIFEIVKFMRNACDVIVDGLLADRTSNAIKMGNYLTSGL